MIVHRTLIQPDNLLSFASPLSFIFLSEYKPSLWIVDIKVSYQFCVISSHFFPFLVMTICHFWLFTVLLALLQTFCICFNLCVISNHLLWHFVSLFLMITSSHFFFTFEHFKGWMIDTKESQQFENIFLFPLASFSLNFCKFFLRWHFLSFLSWFVTFCHILSFFHIICYTTIEQTDGATDGETQALIRI